MLSAKRMSKALQQVGIKVVNYEESKDPKFMDGDVALENSLNVQLGFDYACLCLVKEDGIDYLLEMEEVYNEADIATQIARFLQTWQP
jgi:signal recognition particle subunit SEC65